MFHSHGDDHPCNVEGIGTIHIKIFDEIVRESEVYTSTQKESYLSWCFENIRSCSIYTRWCYQDDQSLNGDFEGRPPE